MSVKDVLLGYCSGNAMTQVLQYDQSIAIAPYSLVLDISGMKCAGCVKAVEKRLLQYPGVIGSAVNLITESALVQFDPATPLDTLALTQQLTTAGFPAQLRHDTRYPAFSPQQLTNDITKQRYPATQHQIWQVAIAGVLVVRTSE
jgi:P-type Cu2+ transporter